MFGLDKKLKAVDVVETPSTETTAPTAKPALLRDVLVEQLRKLAEAGDVQAIRTLLDRPELMSGPKPDVPMTYEDCRRELERVVRDLMKRAGVDTADELLFGAKPEAVDVAAKRQELERLLEKQRKRENDPVAWFHEAIEQRLKSEDHLVALSAWHELTTAQRMGMWSELFNGLHELGAEVMKDGHKVVVQ
jgi:hypothetical protein